MKKKYLRVAIFLLLVQIATAGVTFAGDFDLPIVLDSKVNNVSK